MIDEFLKEKERLIKTNYECKNTSSTWEDYSFQYLLVQTISESMMIKNYDSFNHIINTYRDKIDVLLTLNFYELAENDDSSIFDSNDYSANISLLGLALKLKDPHFSKEIISLLKPNSIYRNSIISEIIEYDDRENFLEIVKYLNNDEQITELIVSTIKTAIKSYDVSLTLNANEASIKNSFISWLTDFDFTKDIIYQKSNEIFQNEDLFSLNRTSFFVILPYAEKKLLNTLINNKDNIKNISRYGKLKNHFNDVISSLVNNDVIKVSEDKEIIDNLKLKFDELNNNKPKEELEKLWFDLILKEQKIKNKPLKL